MQGFSLTSRVLGGLIDLVQKTASIILLLERSAFKRVKHTCLSNLLRSKIHDFLALVNNIAMSSGMSSEI